MTLSFRISNVKPCSINKAYSRNRNGTLRLSQEGSRYSKRFLITMSKNREIVKGLHALRDLFDPLKHAIRLFTVYYIPEKECVTKKGYISRKGGDIDNYLKMTTDFICSSKYYHKTFPLCDHPTIINLNIDDQFIIDYDASKRVSPDDIYHIDIDIEIIPIDTVRGHREPHISSFYEPSDSE